MAIIYDEAQSIFHLQTQVSSYVMQVVWGKYLSHLYWGRRGEQYRGSRAIIWKDRGFAPNPDDTDRTFSLLMGNDVEPRRDFILANAGRISMLDV